ncbi:hypothetical protein SDC9_198322 [bioreactor metagenome]|uniref:Uncharacterized protein n=1 Tax=bioreactor metagenome TaxID=1076179 RepID=A0A645IHV3_9ZZZZ
MRHDGMHHFRAFLVFAGDIRADHGMRAFHLVVDGFADIMQQAGALGKSNIRTQLRRHHARQMRDLDAVL